MLYKAAAALPICRNPFHTPVCQSSYCLDKDLHRLIDIKCNNRLHGVELQLTSFGSYRDRQIIADDLKSYLIHDFRNDRIDLSRHD